MFMMSLIYSQLSVVYSSSRDLEVLLRKLFLALRTTYSPVFSYGFHGGSAVKNLPATQEPLQEGGLGQEDLLK